MQHHNTTSETYKEYHTIFKPKHDEIIFPDVIYRLISQRVRGTVLDIGTGDGYKLGNILKGCNHKKIGTVIGIEPSPLYQQAVAAFNNTNVQVINTDWQSFCQTTKVKFDTIVCFEVLEHVREQQQFLSSIKDLLAPDGCLICSTPNRPIYRLSCKITGEAPDPTHVSELNLPELKTLMKQYFRRTVYRGFFPYMKLYQKYRFFNIIDKIAPFIGWSRTFYCCADNRQNG